MDPEAVVHLLGRWTSGSGPLYRRLAAAIGRAIRRGALSAGDALPPERVLAARLSVSRTTVVAAYDELRQSGLVTSRQGSGTWVAGSRRPERLAPEPSLPSGSFFANLSSGGDVIDLSLACVTDPGGLDEETLQVRGEELEDAEVSRGYAPQGLTVLREAIAAMYATSGLPTHADEILVTTGAQQAIALLGSALAERGAPVLVDAPTYPGAIDVFTRAEARLVPIPVGRDGVDPERFAAAVARWRPRAAYLIPGYNNPTGALTPSRALRAIGDASADASVVLIEDDAAGVIPLGPSRPPPFAALARAAPQATVVTVGSLSKLVWPGLRVGWIRAPRALVSRLHRLKITADLGSPVMGQLVAARLVPQIERLRDERRHLLRPRLRAVEDALAERLPEWSWTSPAGGVTLWICLPSTDAEAFVQVALQSGVALAPGVAMSPDGGFRDHVRLALAAEPEELSEAVERLAGAWRRHTASSGRVPERVDVLV